MIERPRTSRYNLAVELGCGGEAAYALLNPLSGSFDLASREELERLVLLEEGGQPGAGDATFLDYLRERGYLWGDGEGERRLLDEKFREFNRLLEESPPQLFIIPTYACNLECHYCYQRDLPPREGVISPAVVEAFFETVEARFAEKKVKPFITLYGGEPLIPSPRQVAAVSRLAAGTARLGYELAVVTNGYGLQDYLHVLGQAPIKEIQVTLDGAEAIHDARRPAAGGEGTFARILAGVEEAVRRGWPVNLRVVLDRENLPYLPELATIVERRGWLELGPERFKTQLGRNYELFACDARPGGLYSPLELWQAVVELGKRYPVVRRFHAPEFKGLRHLAEAGELYPPTFDACPAFKKEWVFDLYGHIYWCTATCGREDFRAGTFWPEWELLPGKVEPWLRRNIFSIRQCRECPVALLCGGGCGAVAYRENGEVGSPQCRPVAELVAMGVIYYRREILQRAHVPCLQSGEVAPAFHEKGGRK